MTEPILPPPPEPGIGWTYNNPVMPPPPQPPKNNKRRNIIIVSSVVTAVVIVVALVIGFMLPSGSVIEVTPSTGPESTVAPTVAPYTPAPTVTPTPPVYGVPTPSPTTDPTATDPTGRNGYTPEITVPDSAAYPGDTGRVVNACRIAFIKTLNLPDGVYNFSSYNFAIPDLDSDGNHNGWIVHDAVNGDTWGLDFTFSNPAVAGSRFWCGAQLVPTGGTTVSIKFIA